MFNSRQISQTMKKKVARNTKMRAMTYQMTKKKLKLALSLMTVLNSIAKIEKDEQ
jgi:hypothetical protein